MAVEAVAAQSNRTSAVSLTANRVSGGNSDGFANLLMQSASTLGQDQNQGLANAGMTQSPADDVTAKHSKAATSRRTANTQFNALQAPVSDVSTASLDTQAMLQMPSSQEMSQTAPSSLTATSSSGSTAPAAMNRSPQPDMQEQRFIAPQSASAGSRSGGMGKTLATTGGKPGRKTESPTNQDSNSAAATKTGEETRSQTTDAAQEAQAAQAPAVTPTPAQQATAGESEGPSNSAPIDPAGAMDAATAPTTPLAPEPPLEQGAAAATTPTDTDGADGQAAQAPSSAQPNAVPGAGGQITDPATTQSPSANTGASAQTAEAAQQTSQTTAAQAAALSQIAGATPVSVKSTGTAAGESVPQQSTSQLASSAAVAAATTTTTEASASSSASVTIQDQNDLSLGVVPITPQTSGGQTGTATSSGDQGMDSRDGSSPSPFGLANAQAPFQVSTSSSAGDGTLTAAAPLTATVATAGEMVKTSPSTEGIIVSPVSAQGLAQTQETSQTGSSQTVRQTVQPSPLDQIKVQLTKSLKDGADTMSLQLHPADLGRVEVKLEMQNGQVKATVTADRPETLQLLKNDASSLQQSLNNAGLSTDANSLSFHLRDEQQQRQAAQNGQTGQNGGSSGLVSDESETDEEDGISAAQALAALQQIGDGSNGLDINV